MKINIEKKDIRNREPAREEYVLYFGRGDNTKAGIDGNEKAEIRDGWW